MRRGRLVEVRQPPARMTLPAVPSGVVTPVPTHELRDPRVGTRALDWQTTNWELTQEWDAEQAYRWGYIANTYVYSCVDRIAKAIAGSPFRAGKDPDEPGDFDVNCELARLLGPPPGSPNPSLSPRRLWRWTVAQYLVTGRWCWEKERGAGTVIGLWPIPSRLVQPIPTDGGRAYFSGLRYGRDQRASQELKMEDVVYDWAPSQHDIRQAESVLQAARLDISVAVMQDRYDNAFLRNDARPSAVIVHEMFAERGERDAWRQQFLSEYRGVDNAGRPIFVEATPGEQELNETFHIERLGLSQKDAEFIARYESKIRAICVAFGTPLSILGDASNRTFENANVEYTNWWEGTLLPLMDELTDAVNVQLAPNLGKEIGWFDVSQVAALKAKSKILALGPALPTFVQANIIHPNEVRSELDLPPQDEVFSDEELNPPVPPQLAPFTGQPPPGEGTPAEADQTAPTQAGQATAGAANEAIAANGPAARGLPDLEVTARVRVEPLPDGSLRVVRLNGVHP